MTNWSTIALVVNLITFLIGIQADIQTADMDTDSQKISLTESEPSKSNLLVNEENRMSKRASFMPSRGKKLNQFDNIDISDKRASSGFLPMRGRKDLDPQTEGWLVDRPAYQQQIGANDKRAGFMPMRGRKNSDYDSDSKAADDSSFDVYPMELYDMKRMSSFMPMRGRKYDNNNDWNFALKQPYTQSIQNIDSTNWMEGQHSLNNREGLNSFSSGPVVEKKANAFFGARGKRSAMDYSGSRIQPHKRSDSHHKYNDNFFAARG